MVSPYSLAFDPIISGFAPSPLILCRQKWDGCSTKNDWLSSKHAFSCTVLPPFMAMLRGEIRFQTIVCVPKKLWLFPWFSDKEIDDNWCVYNLQTRMMINQCFARTFPHFQETKNLHPPSPDPLSWSQAFLYLFRQEGTGEMAVLTGIVQHEGDRNRGITSAIAVQLQTYQWHFSWILTGLWLFYVLLMLFLFFWGWL